MKNDLLQQIPVLDPRDDLRRLLPTDFAYKTEGESSFVIEDTVEALKEHYPILAQDVGEAIARHAGEMNAQFLSADMVVTEDMPADMGEHNPNAIILYEEEGRLPPFMSGTQAYTINGTRSYKANISDVDAFMQAGRKRRLVLYLGSFKADDLLPLDFDAEMLIDALAALGMADEAIEQFVSMLLSGDAPPALAQVAKDVLALAASVDPAQVAALQSRIQDNLSAALADAKGRQMATLAAIGAAFQPLVKEAPTTLIARALTQPVLSQRLQGLKNIAGVLTATAALARDPVLSVRDVAAIKAALVTARMNLTNPNGQGPAALNRLARIVAPIAKANAISMPAARAGIGMVQQTTLATRVQRVMGQLPRMAATMAASVIAPRAAAPMMATRSVGVPERSARSASVSPVVSATAEAPRASVPVVEAPRVEASSPPPAAPPVQAAQELKTETPQPPQPQAQQPQQPQIPAAPVNDNLIVTVPVITTSPVIPPAPPIPGPIAGPVIDAPFIPPMIEANEPPPSAPPAPGDDPVVPPEIKPEPPITETPPPPPEPEPPVEDQDPDPGPPQDPCPKGGPTCPCKGPFEDAATPPPPGEPPVFLDPKGKPIEITPEHKIEDQRKWDIVLNNPDNPLYKPPGGGLPLDLPRPKGPFCGHADCDHLKPPETAAEKLAKRRAAVAEAKAQQPKLTR